MPSIFWKIPKEWVRDWGLSWNEAGILSDILDWRCPLSGHAARCGVSDRTMRNALDSVAVKARSCTDLSALLRSDPFSEIFSELDGKIFRKMRKNFPNRTEKFSTPPHTPLQIN